MTVGERILKLRKARGLTQIELARQAKMSQPFLSEIESGKRHSGRLSIASAKKLAKVLRVTIDTLAGYNPRLELDKDLPIELSEESNGQRATDSTSTAPTSEAWIKTAHRSRGKN
jgi:transcriptional regulator with XRE-family HTH domain